MQKIDHNSALQSVNSALFPKADFIDGRSEIDRLNFLVEFASLVNFYDSNNNIHGNWSPFLLKDPLFLLASISKTDFQLIKTRFRTAIEKRSSSLVDAALSTANYEWNQVFDVLIEVFLKLERWTHFMSQQTTDYSLRTYMLIEVKTVYSQYLWALLAFRQDAFNRFKDWEITTVNYSQFEEFDATIWKENKGKQPFWDLLNLKDYPTKSTPGIWIQSLKVIGDDLLNFFESIISYSKAEFLAVKTRSGMYPDTLLLRTFVELLSFQQKQLNTLAGKHLEFYFKKILLQSPKQALADRVLLGAALAKKDACFILPKDILFNAGVDTNKDPIVFKSITDTSMNPARIVNAISLNVTAIPNRSIASTPSLADAKNHYFRLRLTKTTKPNVLKKDDQGNMLSWPTFGPSATAEINTKIGFSVASPLFYLKEGQRTIEIDFSFTDTIDVNLFKKASFFLSTAKAWLPIEKTKFAIGRGESLFSNHIAITINLNSGDPSIERFAKDPDGLPSRWPLFKIEFDELLNIANPPKIKSLKIDVRVFEIKTFQLYNDHGLLDTKAPFPLFGPLPNSKANFIIGNTEILSKPTDLLSLSIDWDNLPQLGFEAYYEIYNTYLEHKYNDVKGTTNLSPIPKKLTFIEAIIKCITKYLKNKEKKEAPPYYTDLTFQINFELLQNRIWQPMTIKKVKDVTISKGEIDVEPYSDTYNCFPEMKPDDIYLFSTDGTACSLSDSSYYVRRNVSSENLDATIQNAPLTFSDKSSNGFIKMQLTNPTHGFGANLYAQVVSAVALQNALIIAKRNTSSEDKIVKAPNVPFTPKVKGLTANYTASKIYTFQTENNDYPLQCFHYGIFNNSSVYESDPHIKTPNELSNDIFLYSKVSEEGILYLEIEKLKSSANLSVYFEFSNVYVDPALLPGTITYQYLSKSGWADLPIILNQTQDLTCSGIITFQIPNDISTNDPNMPGPNSWVAISINTNAASIANTSLILSNCFYVERLMPTQQDNLILNTIKPDSIKNAVTAIPEIASFSQPFASFGGREVESDSEMIKRVSSRLKNRDRAVTSGDLFNIVREAFPEIYYAKIIDGNNARTTEVVLVNSISNPRGSNPYLPLVSGCRIDAINTYFEQRASPFINIRATNFQPEYVSVNVTVEIKIGFEEAEVKKKVKSVLNIYLSPWISNTGEGSSLVIDTGLDVALITLFIESIMGVEAVSKFSLDLALGTKENKIRTITKGVVYPKNTNGLFVSSLEHQIT